MVIGLENRFYSIYVMKRTDFFVPTSSGSLVRNLPKIIGRIMLFFGD
jgi:hypothetical protein